MDEHELDARRNFVDNGVLAQVRADFPVVLADDPVVDPSAARGLEQWVAEEQHEPATRLERSGHFVDHDLERVDVFEGEANEHGVECGAPARQRIHARRA